MEKVWFKLRQTDYPPPSPTAMGQGTQTGPLELGHFIPNLRHLDFPINDNDVKPFPRSMPVYTTSALNFQWDDSRSRETGTALGGGAPILAAAGLPVTAKASLGAVFKASVESHEEYERLDTHLVQVTRAYVADCLEGGKVAEYVNDKSRLGSWSIFIITGLKIARAGSRSTSTSRGAEYGIGVGAELPAIASADIEATVGSNREKAMGSQKQSDFIWAIRLAKVSKGLLMKNWSLEPYTKKATFDDADIEADAQQTVAAEGERGFHLFEDDNLGEVVVVFHDEAEGKTGV